MQVCKGKKKDLHASWPRGERTGPLRFGPDSRKAVRPRRPLCSWKPGAGGGGSRQLVVGVTVVPRRSSCAREPPPACTGLRDAGSEKLSAQAGPRMGLGRHLGRAHSAQCHLPPRHSRFPATGSSPPSFPPSPRTGVPDQDRVRSGPVREPLLHSASTSSPPSPPLQDLRPLILLPRVPLSPQAGAPGALR